MSVFGIIFAISVLLIAAVIIYDILVKQSTPQQALEVFIKSDWSTRLSELGIVSDAFLEKVGFAIKG